MRTRCATRKYSDVDPDFRCACKPMRSESTPKAFMRVRVTRRATTSLMNGTKVSQSSGSFETNQLHTAKIQRCATDCAQLELMSGAQTAGLSTTQNVDCTRKFPACFRVCRNMHACVSVCVRVWKTVVACVKECTFSLTLKFSPRSGLCHVKFGRYRQVQDGRLMVTVQMVQERFPVQPVFKWSLHRSTGGCAHRFKWPLLRVSEHYWSSCASV